MEENAEQWVLIATVRKVATPHSVPGHQQRSTISAPGSFFFLPLFQTRHNFSINIEEGEKKSRINDISYPPSLKGYVYIIGKCKLPKLFIRRKKMFEEDGRIRTDDFNQLIGNGKSREPYRGEVVA